MVKKILGEKKGGPQYLVIFLRFLDLENFYKCLTFQGGKTLFFKKCPNNGLVSEKKIHWFFFRVGGLPRSGCSEQFPVNGNF